MSGKDKRVKAMRSPVCPNNTRHGLVPDAKGGYSCEACKEELAGTRSRAATRWAFVGLDYEPSVE